jgi:hypothetical protein
MDQNRVLSDCFDNVFRGEAVAPDSQTDEPHQSAVALRCLRTLESSLSAKMGLMNLHIAGFGDGVADSVSHIDRLGQEPVAHFLSHQVQVEAVFGAREAFENGEIEF